MAPFLIRDIKEIRNIGKRRLVPRNKKREMSLKSYPPSDSGEKGRSRRKAMGKEVV